VTKLKYDVSGIEESEDRGFTPYDGPVPKPGIYNAHVSKAEIGESGNGNQQVVWILVIDDEPYEGCPLWLYTVVTGDEEKDWKFAETIRALGMKDKATFDDEKVTEAQPKCRVRTIVETYTPEGGEPERRAKPRRVLPADPEAKAKGGKAKDEDDNDDDSSPF
jgi:hypothetical protein